MAIGLMIIYCFQTFLIDFSIYLTFYLPKDTHVFTRFVFFFLAVLFSGFLYVFAYSSASLYHAAHSPYKLLNSILTKNINRKVFLRTKNLLKISFYIERFSGPAITNWCYNLFPLRSYEFYLFVAFVARNFFRIVSLCNR